MHLQKNTCHMVWKKVNISVDSVPYENIQDHVPSGDVIFCCFVDMAGFAMLL